jgi:hypothetical protein
VVSLDLHVHGNRYGALEIASLSPKLLIGVIACIPLARSRAHERKQDALEIKKL